MDKIIPNIHLYHLNSDIFNNLNKNEYYDLFYIHYVLNQVKISNINKFEKKDDKIIEKLINSDNIYIKGWSLYLYLNVWQPYSNYLYRSNNYFLIFKPKNKNRYLFEKLIYEKFYFNLYPQTIKYHKYIIKKYDIKHKNLIIPYYFDKKKYKINYIFKYKLDKYDFHCYQIYLFSKNNIKKSKINLFVRMCKYKQINFIHLIIKK